MKNNTKLILEELLGLVVRIDSQSIQNKHEPSDDLLAPIVRTFIEQGNLNHVDEIRLSKRLLDKTIYFSCDHILMLHPSLSSDEALGHHFFVCHKMLLLAEMLNNLGYQISALCVSKKLVRRSKRYYFLQLTFQGNRLLYTIYNRLGDLQKEKKANQEFLKYLKYYEIEKRIELARNELFIHYNKTQEKSNLIKKKCDAILKEYGKYENKIPSFYFHVYFFFVKYVKYLNENNNEEVYNNASTALNWFRGLPFDYVPGKLIFTYVKIQYFIQKKKFSQCAVLLKEAYEFIASGSIHWFRLKEYEVLLYLHERKYDQSTRLFYETVQHKSFKTLLPHHQQKWMLFEAYTRLLIETNIANYADRKRNFSIQRFLNELPTFSKDKRAMNIPVLIAQMSLLIVRGKYVKALDRIRALEKYASRYLKKESTFRSDCFIKLLLIIPKQGFNRIAVERHSNKFYNLLVNAEIQLIDQPFEIEILPYEDLWELLLNYLSQQHHFKNTELV